MGLLGGDSSSRTQNQTTNTSVGVQSGYGISGGKGDITITDQGAVKNALDAVTAAVQNALGFGANAVNKSTDLAGVVVHQAGDNLSNALNFVNDAVHNVSQIGVEAQAGNQQLAQSALSLAESVKTGFSTQMTKFLFIIVGIVGVAMILRPAKK